MWRKGNKDQSNKNKLNNNRLRVVVAVVFLLSGALLYKLFSIQIKQFDLYTAMASSQHRIYSEIKAERGKIFFGEKNNNQEKLYPLATNKDFADLYVVPKDIASSTEVAEKLYKYFDEPILLEELKKEIASGYDLIISTSTKEEIIQKYLKKLDKPGDPYESLNKKMGTDELLKLFAYLASSETEIKAEDLEIRGGQVFYLSGDLAGEKFSLPGFGFDLQQHRYYPEKEIASHLLGFVSYIDNEENGRYGLEEFFNSELFGEYGYLKSEKAAGSNTIIVNDREYTKPVNGVDLVLTIDRNIEFVACEKLKESVKKHEADGGTVIVVEPKSGAIIAMCSVPDFNPNDYKNVDDIAVYNNPAIFSQYEPGSVFKVVTMAIAIDQNKVSPNTTYKDEGQIMINGWPKPIKNSDFSTKGPHGIVDMNAVLENSLNTGAIFAMRQAGVKAFSEYVENFGFGERTGIELGAESPGNIDNLLKNKVKEIDAATASFGQGIAVTPLQMLMSYQALANDGVLMKPYVVKEIIRQNSQKEIITPQSVRRVVSAKTADTMLAMLVNIVERGHSSRAYIPGYYIGGKTGTAQIAGMGGYKQNEYIHTFIGVAPIENPKFVMLTKIDNPKDVIYAEGSVVPLWKDIADFILKYYQIPKTRN